MTNQPDPQKTAIPPESQLDIDNGKESTTYPNLPAREYINSLSSRNPLRKRIFLVQEVEPANPWLLLTSVAVMGIGVFFNWEWVGISGAIVALLLSLQVLFPSVRDWLLRYLTPSERKAAISILVLLIAVAVLAKYLGVYVRITNWLNEFKYDEFGSWAEWVGAFGQILIAIIAVYVAWEQYVISKELTTQQNRITQQQTIDAYFQGISDLALDEEGLLEDWPQERAIAEGRTAAILSSVDASGKAKILRFLSQSRLLTPIKRDNFIGRPILDGSGGYAEDRAAGIRVVTLGVMLAGSDLSAQDLRWVDLSEANMVRADLSYCDLVKANFARTVLYEANLKGSDLKSTRLFYGFLETASPRSRTLAPDYESGAHTGVVIENANLTGVKNLSEEQRQYFCTWGGEKTRATIPGGCEGIPNKLGR